MIRVLFVCVHNSARSQMAEGLARHFGAGGIEVYSAGSQPTAIHPFAEQVMAEMGIDISGQFAKSFSDVTGHRFDFVITLCGEGEVTCPVFPGRYERLYWPLPDPSAVTGSVEVRIAAFRAVRDSLATNIKKFLTAPSP